MGTPDLRYYRAFIAAYDAWATDEDHGMGGTQFDAMIAARAALDDAPPPPLERGDLRVWHIPQVPGSPFCVSVSSPVEALKIMDILATYDQFQYTEHIKGDYSNVQGLEQWDGDEWVEWSDEETGDDIDEWGKRHGHIF